jgi:hypothetical protein
MAVVFTFPGKMGDAILQYPVAFHYAKQSGEKIELWMDEKSCAPLVPLMEAQPCVEKVKLVGGVENYNCGGQPFHLSLPTSAFEGNKIYHLGMRAFPVRQISLQALSESKVPVTVPVEEFANTPYLEVGEVEKANRLVIHGQSICPHTRSTPTMWKFLSGIRAELEALFDEIIFVGSAGDREVGKATYPGWGEYDDVGDFLKLARLIAGSRCMIGCGSSPVTIAGALKIPAVRVHDRIANDAPRMIWDNLGETQLNRTEIELRDEWPKFRDRWLKEVVAEEIAGA